MIKLDGCLIFVALRGEGATSRGDKEQKNPFSTSCYEFLKWLLF